MDMSDAPSAMTERARTAGHAPVLVFGSDTSAFLGTVRSLGRKGLAVHSAGCEAHMPASASRYIVADHAVPLYENDGREWVARVRELVARQGFGLLVPTSDASLAQLAAHRGELGADVAAPQNAALELLTDKWATREAALELGIPIPRAQLVDGDSSASRIADELGIPLVLKSCHSYRLGERVQKSGVALIENEAQLEAALARAQDAMVERFIPGFCKGVSVLAKDGAVLQAFQHRRLRQEHVTGPSSWRISEALDPHLLDAARKLVERSGLTGVAMFEFRFDEEGKEFALLEVNPRFWGSMQLAADAGADYPALLHAMLLEDAAPEGLLSYPEGLQKRSVWGEFDALSHSWGDADRLPAKARAAKRLAGFMVALASRDGFDSYAPDDPAPFERERAQVLGRLRARLTGREPLGGRGTGRET